MGGIHSQDSDNESDYYRLDNFRPSDDYSDSDYDIDDRYSDDNPQSDNDYDSDSTHMTDLPNAQNLDDWSDLSEFENLQTERNDSIHENVGTDYDPNIAIDSDSQDMTDNEDETFPNVDSRSQSPDLFADDEGPPHVDSAMFRRRKRRKLENNDGCEYCERCKNCGRTRHELLKLLEENSDSDSDSEN